MRREIKFRAWDHDAGRYYYAEDLAPEPHRESIHGTPFPKTYYLPMSFLLGDSNDWVWEQFTGMLDKSGKEIYEGDIVSFGSWSNPSVVRYGEQDVGHDFQGVGFYTDRGDGTVGNLYSGVEVIGNVHENEELLTSANA